MSYTKQQILDWVDGYLSYHDVLSIVEELVDDKYKDWLIGRITEMLREMDTQEIEERFEYNENLTEMAVATIKEAKREDIIKAILDGMGYDNEEDIFGDMSSDLGDKP